MYGVVEQLFYYAKTAFAPSPLTFTCNPAILFGPYLAGLRPDTRATLCESTSACCHGVIFSRLREHDFHKLLAVLMYFLEEQLDRMSGKCIEEG